MLERVPVDSIVASSGVTHERAQTLLGGTLVLAELAYRLDSARGRPGGLREGAARASPSRSRPPPDVPGGNSSAGGHRFDTRSKPGPTPQTPPIGDNLGAAMSHRPRSISRGIRSPASPRVSRASSPGRSPRNHCAVHLGVPTDLLATSKIEDFVPVLAYRCSRAAEGARTGGGHDHEAATRCSSSVSRTPAAARWPQVWSGFAPADRSTSAPRKLTCRGSESRSRRGHDRARRRHGRGTRNHSRMRSCEPRTS